jgi:topoisomerase-4 subunit A
MSRLKPLMEKNFIEYASYVIIDRAIPDVRDGCKPVQRRILHTLSEMHDGKFHKVANVIGETMKLHPHGETSIGDALVLLANKEYFIEKQGNFGNIITGHSAAAPRYIECRLTPLALETLFNKPLTTFIPSYDGRKMEPMQLPAKVPVLLMLGTEGIAVGLSTRILPHNFIELLEGQIKILKKQAVAIYPDFFQGGLVDVSDYEDGKGKVRIRARIDKASEKKLILREIPYSTTTTSLISSIEAAVQKGKVGIASINDFTTDRVEIELNTARGVTTDEVIPQLYAYTDCEVSLSSNIVAIRNNRPIETTVSEYLTEITSLLKKQIKDELTYELKDLEDRQHWLTLEQIFIENRIYKRIENAKTERQVRKQVYEGMSPYSHLFIRKMTDEDVRMLLDLRIRRISAYDIKKHRDQIEEVIVAIAECRSKLRSLTKTAIGYLRGLIEKYREIYPRCSQIKEFETVDKRSVAKANIRLGYDKSTGFFGSSVKEQDRTLTVSEYDRILVVSNDGTYRIIAPPEKVLLPNKLIYCNRFDPEKGVDFTFVYRDGNRIAWAKKVHIEKFITDKVYELCKSGPKGIDYFNSTGKPGIIRFHFMPKPRQKISNAKIDLKLIKPCGLTARGTRLHAKPVKRIEVMSRRKKKGQRKS